jgi:hypothetical protein
MRYGALGDIAVFVLAEVGMYLSRPGRKTVGPRAAEASAGRGFFR